MIGIYLSIHARRHITTLGSWLAKLGLAGWFGWISEAMFFFANEREGVLWVHETFPGDTNTSLPLLTRYLIY
jgi:hypothetical protein